MIKSIALTPVGHYSYNTARALGRSRVQSLFAANPGYGLYPYSQHRSYEKHALTDAGLAGYQVKRQQKATKKELKRARKNGGD